MSLIIPTDLGMNHINFTKPLYEGFQCTRLKAVVPTTLTQHIKLSLKIPTY